MKTPIVRLLIAGHRIFKSERRVLSAVRAYLAAHAGDSTFGENTPATGNGRWVSIDDIFPGSAGDTVVDRRIVHRLAQLGVLGASGVALLDGQVKAMPVAMPPHTRHGRSK